MHIWKNLKGNYSTRLLKNREIFFQQDLSKFRSQELEDREKMTKMDGQKCSSFIFCGASSKFLSAQREEGN